MKRIIAFILSGIVAMGCWSTFIGFSEGVESSSNGNYLTLNGKHAAIIVHERDFSLAIDDSLFLHGSVSDPFDERTPVILKLSGSRNRRLFYGVDPLPTREDIAQVVQNELIAHGAPSDVKLSVITLPLDDK